MRLASVNIKMASNGGKRPDEVKADTPSLEQRPHFTTYEQRVAQNAVIALQALNESSLESGSLMCQLYNFEINIYITQLINELWRLQHVSAVKRPIVHLF